jgi:hypothetical protein
MSRLRWPLLVLLICAPVAVLATGVPLPFLNRPAGLPTPLPVPAGDQELAWLHTSTNATTWERYVSGMIRAQLLVPGLTVDDSAAFADQTTSVPEVVLAMAGRPGNLRVRWYKLTNEATTAGWVRALAGRSPAPLALVGGGSSDRAVDLATALAAEGGWRGDRPLLFITTATADEVATDTGDTPNPLIDLYDDRSFRFCFTNRQMADAVIDFVFSHPQLRPEVFGGDARSAAGGGWTATLDPPEKPTAFSPVWEDDPFSLDLHRRFADAIWGKAHQLTYQVRFSVGGFSRPNQFEGKAAEHILQDLRDLPRQRSLLVLPTVTQPARRVLRTLAESVPQLGQRLVAVTGDGIAVNSLYRDGEFAWPVHALPVPLVLFTHHDPCGWDEKPDALPPGLAFTRPNSTDDVLHFAELTRVVVEAAYPGAETPTIPQPAVGPVPRANQLADRLRNRRPAFFDADGNRLGGTGEFVAVLWPQTEGGNAGPRTLSVAKLAVWRRPGATGWEHVRTVDVDQRRSRASIPKPAPAHAAAPPARGPRG